MPNFRKLRGVMAEVGYTQAALAEEMKMSRSTLSSKINGKLHFDVEEATKICEILKITDPELKCEIFLR